MRKKLGNADIRMNDDLTPKQRSTLKGLRDDGYTAFYRGTKLFSKRKRQPDQQATAVVSSMDSDDEAQFDDDDEVYRGGCGAVEDPTFSPARRSLNFNDSNGRPRSMAADENANSTGDRTRQQTPSHSSEARGRGIRRRGGVGSGNGAVGAGSGGDGSESDTSLRGFGRGGMHSGSGSHDRSRSGRSVSVDEVEREASPVLRPRTRKQTTSTADDNRATAGHTSSQQSQGHIDEKETTAALTSSRTH